MALKEKEIVPKWRIFVKDGKMTIQNKEAFSRYLLNFEGKEGTLVVRKPVKERSRQEEKFYHAVVVRMVAEAMEIMPQEAHEILKNMFLRVEETSPAGFRYYRSLSTTELSDASYREYWEKIIRWASLPTGEDGLGPDSGLEIYIPYPNEVDYENVYSQ